MFLITASMGIPVSYSICMGAPKKPQVQLTISALLSTSTITISSGKAQEKRKCHCSAPNSYTTDRNQLTVSHFYKEELRQAKAVDWCQMIIQEMEFEETLILNYRWYSLNNIRRTSPKWKRNLQSSWNKAKPRGLARNNTINSSMLRIRQSPKVDTRTI